MNNPFLTGALAFGVATTAAVVSIQPAEAIVVNLGLGGSGPLPGNFPGVPSLVITDPATGLQVTATGTDTNGNTRNVFQFNGGLGVTTDNDESWNGAATQIDGFSVPLGLAEILNLDFNKQVRLISAKFKNVQKNDDFGLIVDNSFIGKSDIPGNNVYTFSGTYISQSFGFTAPNFNDDFYLKEVEVEIIPTPAAVLPGLMGMGAAAFRKKKQTGEVGA